MEEIYLDAGDLVVTNEYTVEIIGNNLTKEPFEGADISTGEKRTFYAKDIYCIKKKGIKPCGSDGYNLWSFYADNYVASYKNNTPYWIAHWAKYMLNDFFGDMSIDEICNKHIFYGNDTNPEYKGMYNGDEVILYKDFNKLSEDYQHDAKMDQ